jgi:hypothetical protein
MRFRAAGPLAVVVVLSVIAAASARIFWVPVAGPMFKPPKHVYFTVKAPLVAPSGQPGSGTVKIDCNGGDDADRLIVKAVDLPANVGCKVWFVEPRSGKRMGEPFVTRTEGDGSLHIVVFGALCYLKEFSHLMVVINEKVALMGDLTPPPPSPSPKK